MQNIRLIVFFIGSFVILKLAVSISKISLPYRFNEFNRHSQVAGADTELFQGGGDG